MIDLREMCLSLLPSPESLDKVSISLMKLGGVSDYVFGINEKQDRYPASIIKLFWAVQALKELELNQELLTELELMLIDSSDEAGQKIVERLVGKDPADKEDFEAHYKKRVKLEQFWIERGFPLLKAAHKTFLNEYSAFDNWIKQNKFINRASASMVSQLWKLIWTADPLLGLSEFQRDKLLLMLQRSSIRHDLKPEEKDFQSSLIGFNLPLNVKFFSKSGWRGDVINDSAVILSSAGQVYVLTIMCELGEAEGIEFIRGFCKKLFAQIEL